jgi:DNA-binding IclR family transcriptional regulator
LPSPVQYVGAFCPTWDIIETRSFRITDLVKRISDANHDLRMNKSTVYRFLSSLKELDFVRQDPETEQYSLTRRLCTGA